MLKFIEHQNLKYIETGHHLPGERNQNPFGGAFHPKQEVKSRSWLNVCQHQKKT
jgi:hypothetical protein